MYPRVFIYRLWTICLVLGLGLALATVPASARQFDNGLESGKKPEETQGKDTKPDSKMDGKQGNAQARDIEWFDYNTAVLQALNKITGRTRTFSMAVGKTRQFGDIYIRLRTCREPPPIEKRESASFLQTWELDKNGDSQWIFSGWMFASSPALSSMDHPVYDVWLLDCTDKDEREIDNETEPKHPGKTGTDNDETRRQKGPAVDRGDEPAIKRERLPSE